MQRMKQSADIVTWVSNVLRMPCQTLDELRTGVALCQLLHSIFPESFDLSRVYFEASSPYHYEKNFKVLQEVMEENNVEKVFIVERLMLGEKLQDLFYFTRWLKCHYDTYMAKAAATRASSGKPQPPLYDAVQERRAAMEKRKQRELRQMKVQRMLREQAELNSVASRSSRGSRTSARTSFSSYATKFDLRRQVAKNPDVVMTWATAVEAPGSASTLNSPMTAETTPDKGEAERAATAVPAQTTPSAAKDDQPPLTTAPVLALQTANFWARGGWPQVESCDVSASSTSASLTPQTVNPPSNPSRVVAHFAAFDKMCDDLMGPPGVVDH